MFQLSRLFLWSKSFLTYFILTLYVTKNVAYFLTNVKSANATEAVAVLVSTSALFWMDLWLQVHDFILF